MTWICGQSSASRIGERAIERRAKIRLAAGQAGKPALARGEIAGRRVDQQHRKPVRRQLGREVGSLHLVGELALDRREARLARRRARSRNGRSVNMVLRLAANRGMASLPCCHLFYLRRWAPPPLR